MVTRLVHKSFVGTEVRADGATSRVVFRASDSAPDRIGDRVFVQGMKTDGYASNPVMLWAHDHSQPPIGTGKVWKEGEGDSTVLYFEPTFADTPRAREVKALVDQGVVKAVSVGVQIDAVATKQNATGGYDLTESSLYEVSLCAVPMNPGTVRVQSLADKGITNEHLVAQLGVLQSKVDALTASHDAHHAEMVKGFTPKEPAPAESAKALPIPESSSSSSFESVLAEWVNAKSQEK